jgi:2-methylcitrate dehydratase
MTAIGLIFGTLTADHYEDAVAKDPRIDALRMKMVVQEDPRYTREYLEADKRSIPNAVQVFFTDGTATPKIEVEYPLGHRRRRKDGIPLLVEKFRSSLSPHFSREESRKILGLFENVSKLELMPVGDFLENFVPA